MVKELDESKIRYLDPTVKLLWSLHIVVFTLVMWLFTSWLAGLAFPDGLFGIPKETYWFLFLMLAGIFLIPYFVWIELRYRTYTYYIADTEMLIRKGVLRREHISIPFEKVQNVNVSRSVLERLLGLATVKIETAGTNPGEAEGIIPGVRNYRELVNEILEHVEYTRAHIITAHQPPKTESVSPISIDQIAKELAALKDEIRQLRAEAKVAAHEPSKEVASQEYETLEFEGDKYKKREVKKIKPKPPRKLKKHKKK